MLPVLPVRTQGCSPAAQSVPGTRPETCGCISTMNYSVPGGTPRRSSYILQRVDTHGATHTYTRRHTRTATRTPPQPHTWPRTRGAAHSPAAGMHREIPAERHPNTPSARNTNSPAKHTDARVHIATQTPHAPKHSRTRSRGSADTRRGVRAASPGSHPRRPGTLAARTRRCARRCPAANPAQTPGSTGPGSRGSRVAAGYRARAARPDPTAPGVPRDRRGYPLQRSAPAQRPGMLRAPPARSDPRRAAPPAPPGAPPGVLSTSTVPARLRGAAAGEGPGMLRGGQGGIAAGPREQR